MTHKETIADNARAAFVHNLTRYMEKRGVTQADLMVEFGVSSATASNWVNGKRYPRVDTMQKLADYLHVRMTDLTAIKSQEDEQLDDMREQMMNRPDLRVLFSLSHKATPEDVQFISEMLKKLTEKGR